MSKRLSLLIASIGVVAFAVPASASAAPAVTESGLLLKPFSKLQATSIGAVVTETSLGNLSCNIFDFTGDLTNNNGETVRFEGIGKGLATTCTISGKPATVSDLTVLEVHSEVVEKGTINMTFQAALPNNVNCHFSSPNMPFTYASGTDVIKVKKGDLKATPAVCEPGMITGEWTIETDGGGTIVLD